MMARRTGLHIADNLWLPTDFVTKTVGILAQRRKGKTYTAKVIAEELVTNGIPFVVIDPTGAWWGLRSGATPDTDGLPVTILGGRHGDIPIERTGGKLLAELVVDEPGWYVIDLSLFEINEAERQFATDFAERLYRRKGREGDDTPLHLFVDEADRFVPQRSPRGDQRMLGAFETLVRRGGIRGIGTTLISQRAAVVNKNVLEQLDLLVVLRTVGPNDQAAIKRYVEAHGSTDEVADLLGSLASLKLGEAWLWEPGAEPSLFERVRIREGRTFNSSATPKVGEKKVEPRRLAPVDLDVLKERMAATIEKADAQDPKKLQARVRELERELAAVETDREVRVETVEVPVVPERVAALLESIDRSVGDLRDAVQGLAAGVEAPLAQVRAELDAAVAVARPTPKKAPTSHSRGPSSPSSGDDARDLAKYRSGARRLMEAVASWPEGCTRQQAATIAGLKRSAFTTYLGELRRDGLIDVEGSTLRATDAGVVAAGVEPVPQDPAEVIAYWRPRFRAGARTMLDLLVEAGAAGVEREALMEQAGLKRSAFTTYLGDLRRALLVEADGGVVRLVEWLR